MYNVEDWIETTIKSISQQSYENFQCVIIDDISSDDSVNIVSELIKNDDRFKLLVNKEKKFALRNIVEGIDYLNPSSEDVILIVDGDDWLAHKNVLNKLNTVYTTQDVWLTYGNHVNYPDGEPYWPLFKYPQSVIDTNSFRNFRFLASHLRTFKYKLWKQIKKEDLQDETGQFFQTAGDLAAMFPMLEMCKDKFCFIEDTLYVYNNKNPANDYKLYHQLQLKTDMILRMKAKYLPKEQL